MGQKFAETKQGIVLGLQVVAGTGEFAVKGFDNWSNELKLKTKSKPLKGEANREIETEFGKILGAEAKIVSGFKSKHKKIVFEENAKEKLLSLLENL